MNWLPLMDYSMKTGVSLSTLRRHIKARKVEYRIENGRYLLLDNGAGATSARDSESETTGVQSQSQSQFQAPSQSHVQALAAVTVAAAAAVAAVRIKKLESDLREAREEISELKMLVALYEDQPSTGKLDN